MSGNIEYAAAIDTDLMIFSLSLWSDIKKLYSLSQLLSLDDLFNTMLISYKYFFLDFLNVHWRVSLPKIYEDLLVHWEMRFQTGRIPVKPRLGITRFSANYNSNKPCKSN